MNNHTTPNWRNLQSRLQQIVEGEEPFGPLPVTEAAEVKPPTKKRAERPVRSVIESMATAATAPTTHDPDAWPAGPTINGAPLEAEAVQRIIETLAITESMANRKTFTQLLRQLGFDGPTSGRLAAPMLTWLAKAELLDGASWKEGYFLTSRTADELRLQLASTALPTEAEIAHERTLGL